MPSSILLALAGLSAGIFGGGSFITLGIVSAWGFSTTTLGGLLLSVGLSVGASLLQSLFTTTPKQTDVQANIRQALGARRRVYGRRKNGSIVVFGFRRGQKIYVLHYICEGPIEGYVTHFLNNKPVTLDEDGFVTDAQYQYGGRSRVRILTTLGTMTDEPFDEILTAFPELDTPDTPFRHRGCAMVLQIVEEVPQAAITDVYPNNLPTYQCILDGLANVVDPEDGTESFEDNAGRCLLTEIMDVYGLAWGDDDEIDFDSFATFATHCDESVALKAGGTEPRYRCAGTITMDSENEARIKAIADICNAHVYMDRQGRIAVRKRLDTTPGIALRAKNGDHLSVSMESGRGLLRQSNTLKGVYVEPLLNWKENQAIYQNAEALAADEQEYSDQFGAIMSGSATQTQRVVKLAWHERNPVYLGSMTSGLQALELLDNHVFTLDLGPEDDIEEVASASAIELDEGSLTVQFGYSCFDPDAEEWDAETEERDIAVAPPDLPVNLADIELDVEATVGLLSNSAPVIRFSWEPADPGDTLPDSWSQQIEVSVADEDEWFAATVNQEDDTATFGPVADGAAYDWRIRNIAGGSPFDWQESTVPVTVTVNPVAPDAPGIGTVTVNAGVATVPVTAPNSANSRYLTIYRVASGGGFGAAVDVSGPLYCAPGQTIAWDDIPSGSASYDWFATASNASNVESDEAGPSTATAGFATESLTAIAAMTVTPSLALKKIINTMIVKMKADSVWTKLDFLNLMSLHTAQASQLNLVSPGTYDLVNSGATFTAYDNFAGNGSSAYMTNGAAWNALSKYTQNDNHVGAWVSGGTDAVANMYSVGATAIPVNVAIRPRYTGGVTAGNTSSNVATFNASSSIIGHTIVGRTGASASKAYRDGVPAGTSAVASTTLTSSAIALFYGVTTYSDYHIRAFHAGSQLTDTDADNIYDAIAAALTAIDAL